MKMTEKKNFKKKFCKSGKSFYLCTRKSETLTEEISEEAKRIKDH